MIRMKVKGEIIAIKMTKSGRHIVTIWDFDPKHTAYTGFYDKTEFPRYGEGVFLVTVSNRCYWINPINKSEKESENSSNLVEKCTFVDEGESYLPF